MFIHSVQFQLFSLIYSYQDLHLNFNVHHSQFTPPHPLYQQVWLVSFLPLLFSTTHSILYLKIFIFGEFTLILHNLPWNTKQGKFSIHLGEIHPFLTILYFIIEYIKDNDLACTSLSLVAAHFFLGPSLVPCMLEISRVSIFAERIVVHLGQLCQLNTQD